MLDANHLPLTDGRARLRSMTHADATLYADGTEDAAVRKYAHLPAARYTPQSVRRMIDSSLAEGLARGDLAVLTVADAATDRFVGSLVLFDVSDDAAEVGFWMRPEARGAGLAGAALGLAARLARRSGLRTLTARTLVENHASRHVLGRAGFVPGEQARSTAPSGELLEMIPYQRLLI